MDHNIRWVSHEFSVCVAIHTKLWKPKTNVKITRMVKKNVIFCGDQHDGLNIQKLSVFSDSRENETRWNISFNAMKQLLSIKNGFFKQGIKLKNCIYRSGF